jgi:hypothetical protein
MPLLPAPYLGCTDKAHLQRWSKEQIEGRNRMPRCAALTRERRPCRHFALPGTPRCNHHLVGRERDRYDVARIPRLTAILDRKASVEAERASRALAAIRRRQLHRAWKIDPTLPGSTIPVLSAADADRVSRWIAERGLDLDGPLPISGQPATARARDRLLWVAILDLGGRLDHPDQRIRAALQDDAEWFARHPSA